MGKGTKPMMRAMKRDAEVRSKLFSERYAQDLIDLPVKIVLSPFTLAFDFAGYAPRGFGVPKLVSDVAFSAIFGVMSRPECKDKLQVRISADNIMEPPWKAYNVMRKIEYPYENIVQSMKDPRIAEFWLITLPRIAGGFNFDEEVNKKYGGHTRNPCVIMYLEMM